MAERTMGQKLDDKAEELKLKTQAAAAGLTGDKAQEAYKNAQAELKEQSNDLKAAADKRERAMDK